MDAHASTHAYTCAYMYVCTYLHACHGSLPARNLIAAGARDSGLNLNLFSCVPLGGGAAEPCQQPRRAGAGRRAAARRADQQRRGDQPGALSPPGPFRQEPPGPRGRGLCRAHSLDAENGGDIIWAAEAGPRGGGDYLVVYLEWISVYPELQIPKKVYKLTNYEFDIISVFQKKVALELCICWLFARGGLPAAAATLRTAQNRVVRILVPSTAQSGKAHPSPGICQTRNCLGSW